MDSIAEVGGVTTLVKDSTFELLFERVREFKCWSPVVKTFCEVLLKRRSFECHYAFFDKRDGCSLAVTLAPTSLNHSIAMLMHQTAVWCLNVGSCPSRLAYASGGQPLSDEYI